MSLEEKTYFVDGVPSPVSLHKMYGLYGWYLCGIPVSPLLTTQEAASEYPKNNDLLSPMFRVKEGRTNEPIVITGEQYSPKKRVFSKRELEAIRSKSTYAFLSSLLREISRDLLQEKRMALRVVSERDSETPTSHQSPESDLSVELYHV